MALAKTIFITGTDTGAGKTLLTAFLLAHLRRRTPRTWAMKPFCTGDRGDVKLFGKLLENELALNVINPYYFVEPVSPLVAARKRHRQIPLEEVLARIKQLRSGCERLLIEGIGGLLSPLGENYSAADLIQSLRCPVIVAARNRLGVINHALLTVKVLVSLGLSQPKLVLFGCSESDASVRTNHLILAKLLSPVEILSIPFLGTRATSIKSVQIHAKEFERTLARAVDFENVLTMSDQRKKKRNLGKGMSAKKNKKHLCSAAIQLISQPYLKAASSKSFSWDQ